MKKGDFSSQVPVVCSCGNTFSVKKSKATKSKYCSKQCLYTYRVMPEKRKAYVVRNPKRKTGPNPNHYLFKGEAASYISIHGWVARHRGKASKCEHCGTETGKIQWANKSHEYKRELTDWIQLCIICHRKHDLDADGNKRTDTRKFNLPKRQPKTQRKLSEEQIITIFKSEKSQPALANEFNVKQNYISRIKSGVRCARITKGLLK